MNHKTVFRLATPPRNSPLERGGTDQYLARGRARLAQLISYELPLLLSVVPVVLAAGTLADRDRRGTTGCMVAPHRAVDKRDRRWPLDAQPSPALVRLHPLGFYRVRYFSDLRPRRAGETPKADIAENPENAEAHKNAGLALDSEQKFDAGIAEYKQALRIKPDFVTGHVDLGVLLQNMRAYDDAIVEYKKALALDPTQFDAHINLGVIYKDVQGRGSRRGD